MSRASSLLGLLLLAAPAWAQEACDTSAIRWHLPHEFGEARARAVREKRILVIKGVSFGIDDEGAKCATKGMW